VALQEPVVHTLPQAMPINRLSPAFKLPVARAALIALRSNWLRTLLLRLPENQFTFTAFTPRAAQIA
jgi:hypothetical protein